MLWLLPELAFSGADSAALAQALAGRGTVGGEPLFAPEALRALYAARDYLPLWSRRRVGMARRALAEAKAHGLWPADYHGSAIAASCADPAAAGRVACELLLSDGLLLLGSHLRSGKVEPGGLQPRRRLRLTDADLPSRLAAAAGPEEFVDGLTSRLAGYGPLCQALGRYRALAAAGGWPRLPDGPTLRAGDRSAAVALLRRRLTREGVEPVAQADSEGFDADLEDAVRRFQARHGLQVDGVVGPRTRAALNISAAQRVDQLIANLERRRWLGQAPGRRQVRVNAAAFTLDAIEGDAAALHMRVVVGRPYRPTPEFSDRIRYLVLNPYWEVPTRLAVKDILPAIQRDPGYLASEHLRVLSGWGPDARELDPAAIDWRRLRRHVPYRLRQDPGPWNALGRIKFMFPNAHDVYLHDTPSRGLFAHAERSFSSGCIRVERALALADWLLQDDPQWTPAALREAIDSGRTRTVNLRAPVPVHLLYWTAWVDSDGRVQFRRDLYRRDPALAAALITPIQTHRP
ncbi:MAG: L,D-transpeptidase family protein [Immundisolibacter sp.]